MYDMKRQDTACFQWTSFGAGPGIDLGVSGWVVCGLFDTTYDSDFLFAGFYRQN